MKKLKDHIILYDAACPMCCLYTRGFQKAGMLDENGRLPYQKIPDNLACMVDLKRSVDEIALVNTRTGEVSYGVASLSKIIVNALPSLRPVSQNRLFLKIANVLYKFISFNRRLILPVENNELKPTAFLPSFQQRYRLAYLVFSLIASAATLHLYANQMTAILPAGTFFREIIICGGQIIWQWTMVRKQGVYKIWDYLGNLMTVSLVGSLLLVLILIFGHLFTVQDPLFYLVAFGVTVFLMLLEHLRRTRILELGWKLSASWLLYRVVVLIILIFNHYVG